MTTYNRIIWHEGMFLQPQHFQQHDRYFEHLIQLRQRCWNNNFWGFLHCDVDLELLSIGKLGLNAATGVFPDGSAFSIPNVDKPPKPMLVPEGLTNTVIYLALPLRQSDTAEAGSDHSDQLYRYDVLTKTIKDSTVGSDEASDIQVGSLALTLLTEHDDVSGYTYLPIARIAESRFNHQVALDKSFITSWLDAHEVDSLTKLVSEVQGALNHRAEMLAGRLTDTQQAGTAEVVDIILLQLANKYEPMFHYLMHQRPLHPADLYFILLQLMGEMATYTRNKRRPIEPPVYRHDDLFNTFKPVIRELRHALSVVLEQNAANIPLELRPHGLWVGQVHDKELLHSCDFILAVYADVPAENIRTLFASQIKIAPVEQIKTYVSKALPGIPISAIAVAPRQIPYHANFSYFSVNTKHELWQYMEKSGGIALHVGSQIPGLRLELWAIKG